MKMLMCSSCAVLIMLSMTPSSIADHHGAQIISYGQRKAGSGVEVEVASHTSGQPAESATLSSTTNSSTSNSLTVAQSSPDSPSSSGALSSGAYRPPPLEWVDYRCSTTPDARAGLDLAVFNDTTRGCITMPEPVVTDRPSPRRGGPRQREAPRPSPEVLARQAFDQAVALARRPELTVAPARVGLTGLESYFWLAEQPRPIGATARAGGLSVTAEAAPMQYVWSFGDGGDLVTDHPGRPWTRGAPGNVAHLYETRGTYDVSIEVVWEARWRSNSGTWQPLGVFSTSDTSAYPVRQVQSRLVPPD